MNDTGGMDFDRDARSPHTPESEPERVVHVRESRHTVGIERSVRYNRLLIAGVVIGAVVGALIAVSFPIGQSADYGMWQIAGFCAVIGGAAGLLLGGMLGIILNRAARHKHGTAEVSQTDVR